MKNNFFTLVGFEYKKIFKRKSTYAAFLMILAVVTFANLGILIGNSHAIGDETLSGYELMKREREYSRALKGYIDEEKILMVLEQNNIANSNPDNFINENGQMSLKDDVKEKYIRPYKEITFLLDRVYAPKNQIYGYDAVNEMDADDAKNFYRNRLEKIEEIMKLNNLTEAETKKYDEMNSQIKTPFYYDHFEGYMDILHFTAANAIFIALGIAICIAPMFSGEYSGLTDQLILTSKYGKNKVIVSKIFTGISFSVIVSVVGLLISTIVLLSAYGFDGANVNLQVLYPFLPYPLTMLQASVIMLFVAMTAILLVSMLTLFLSSKLKNSFGVIIVSNLILFVPMFIPNLPNRSFLSTLIRLLPAKMFEASDVFSEFFFCFGKIAIVPYVFLPVFCLAIVCILIPFTYRAFKKHQIG